MNLRFLILPLFVLIPTAISFGQVSDRDKADAVARAKEFTQRLRRSQDIKPLLSNLFAPDFLNRIGQDNGNNTLVLLEMSGKHIRLTNRQTERYYIASVNMMFLAWSYACWKKPKDGKDEDMVMPSGVRKIMARTKIFQLIFRQDNDPSDEQLLRLLPKTSKEVAALTTNLERINAIYRKSMTLLRLMSDKEFEDLRDKCSGEGDPNDATYKVVMASCNDKGNCPGVPKGVPLIGVSASPFDFLDFARVNGKMKIVRLLLWDESLK